MGGEARRLVYPEEGFGAPGSSCIVVTESKDRALANLHGLLPASARFWPSGLLGAPSDLVKPDDDAARPAKRLCTAPQVGEEEE